MSIVRTVLIVGSTRLETNPKISGKGVKITNNITNTVVAIALMGLVFILLGCTTRSGTYPTSWASIESSASQDGCPNLRGIYSNQGSASSLPKVAPQPLLTDIFKSMASSRSMTGPAAWKQTWPAIPYDVSSISIEQAPDTITVTFIDTSGRRTSLNFRQYRFNWSEKRVDDLFQCLIVSDSPELRFFAEVESIHSIPIVGTGGSATNINLLKSVDGSLIVRWSKNDVAFTPFILGSGIRIDDIWYRYPLVKPEGPPK